MNTRRVVKALGESFTFTLANNTGAAKTVAILAAFFATLALVEGTPNTIKYTDASEITAAGYACDYVLDDGVIVTDLVATSGNSEKTIRAFRNFIKDVGATCVDMDVQGNNVDVFNKVLKVVTANPNGSDTVEYLKLSKFMSVDQTSTSKIVAADLNLDMSADTLILLPIDTGREVTITFNF